jgi:aspartate racemase
MPFVNNGQFSAQSVDPSFAFDRFDPPHVGNHFEGHFPSYQGIHEWFEAQVEKTPDAIALSFHGQSLTYRELNQRANQLAHFFIDQGIQPGELVAISMHRCFEMVVGFWGVLKAGAAYVPIDPAYPQERQTYMLQDSQARIILTQKCLAECWCDQSATVLYLDADWQWTIAAYPTHNPALTVSADHPAYVIYTSGSTGNPKGVKIPHRGVVNHSAAIVQMFELSQRDRVMQFSSMSFDIIVEEVYPALVTGASLVLRPEEISASIHQFLEFVEAHHITVLDLPTAFWHELVNRLAAFNLTMPPSVRLVVVGGEKASRIAYAEWVKQVGHHPRWLNTYGPTETTVTTTIYDPIAANYDPEQGEIPIGKPIANAEVYVLDADLKPVPLGESGELHIGGAGLALEYHNLPGRTSEKFIPNPFSQDPNSRLYKTGDTVRYLSDGNLEFVGRIDFQVKIRGFRIELGEIEICLEQHPSIRQAMVLAREDVPGNQSLVAYVIPQAAQSFDRSEVRLYLTQKLPTYMIPAAFVELDNFPITPNGKADRRALPKPETVALASKAVVAPSNATEAKLLQIWESVLGVSQLSITDNFFDLGGHSLLVARLLDRVAVEFEINLPLSVLLQAPTIEQLAIGLTHPEPMRSLQLIRAGGAKEPIFFIHDGVGEILLYRTLASHLDPERPIYGILPLADAQRPILHTRIEEMAAYYVQLIRSVQPEGSYWLAGLCAGGVLAYEIARQLQAQGNTISMVALMEAVSPTAELKSGLVANQRMNRLTQAMQGQEKANLLVRMAKFGTIVGRKVVNTIAYEISSRIQQKVEAIQFQVFRYCLDRQWTPPLLISPTSVRKTYLFAEQSYVPSTPFEGDVLLLRATVGEGIDRPYHECYADPLFGWESLVTQKVCVYDIPGGHSSMLQAPHVGVLAERIQAYMDQVSHSATPVSSMQLTN